MFSFQDKPHRRYNPLKREWVLVSPHRTQRPWQGQTEKVAPEEKPKYDPKCYLCPGNERAGGVRNPKYEHTFVFRNDFPALLPDTPEKSFEQGLLRAETEAGDCLVICFDPDHSLTVPRMSQEALRRVVDTWKEQYIELGSRDYITHVQIFENRGEMMGASNPHPHCQVWANRTIPNEVRVEIDSQEAYLREHGRCMLCDYLRQERQLNERIIAENEHFVALVPFWAVWPFETIVLSIRHLSGMDQLTSEESDALAAILKLLTTHYDNLFEVSFPYTMGFHQRPWDGQEHPEMHFHAHYYPPLLRSATVKKFMVGYEMLASPQRDITPEAAAQRIREVGSVHYLDRT
ncbi:MAG TPA: UDP-glucose--hexose-1-phosphate uridylyltransferase [Bryobacteraceae bacterium]|nr:UDP-glucose--hexose-1-phosphate uridylyltransferase [Bryobacteraceae bacterium]